MQTKTQELVMIYKWGCGGSSGHSTSKQKFKGGDLNTSDENLFAVCFIPLRLTEGSNIFGKIRNLHQTNFVDH